MRNRLTLLTALLLCAIALNGSKDRPCAAGEFKLVAEPAKRSYARQEPVRIRLTLTNLTSSDVYVIPYLVPFDYWVDKYSEGRWKSLATGIVGPNAKQRHGNSLSPTSRSEYQRVGANESFTTSFDVELGSVTKSPWGKFRLNGVRAHVYSRDSGEQNVGCAIFAETSSPFTVQ